MHTERLSNAAVQGANYFATSLCLRLKQVLIESAFLWIHRRSDCWNNAFNGLLKGARDLAALQTGVSLSGS